MQHSSACSHATSPKAHCQNPTPSNQGSQELSQSRSCSFPHPLVPPAVLRARGTSCPCCPHCSCSLVLSPTGRATFLLFQFSSFYISTLILLLTLISPFPFSPAALSLLNTPSAVLILIFTFTSPFSLPLCEYLLADTFHPFSRHYYPSLSFQFDPSHSKGEKRNLAKFQSTFPSSRNPSHLVLHYTSNE